MQSPRSPSASPLDKFNQNNTTVKRIMREFKDLTKEPSDQYAASPLEDNPFEWHFTIRGPAQTAFEGGVYHGRILLPFEYPLKPPSILLLTPNGRFEINKKICLSISNYHPEEWRPCWSIRTVLVAIRAFMPTKGEGAIGSLDYSDDERKKLALQSLQWSCKACGCCNATALPEEGSVAKPGEQASKEEEAASQICFAVKEGGKPDEEDEQPNEATPQSDGKEAGEGGEKGGKGEGRGKDGSDDSGSQSDEIAEFVDQAEEHSDADSEIKVCNPNSPHHHHAHGHAHTVPRRRLVPEPEVPPPSAPSASAGAVPLQHQQRRALDATDAALVVLACVLVVAIVGVLARKHGMVDW